MVTNFKYDVFISHSAKDKPIVRELAKKLSDDGLIVWFDEWNIRPGDMIGLEIEKGLEASRVLILCMSHNSFSSDWVTLERHTAIFRDPINSQRRFVPIRLDDTPINDTLKQFAYIDWRAKNEDEYVKLLQTCKTQVSTEHVESIEIQTVLKGHTASVYDLAITPDGALAVTGSNDWTLRVWDTNLSKCIGVLKGHTGDVSCVAVSSNGLTAISGSYDSTVRVWDLTTRRVDVVLSGHKSRIKDIAMTHDCHTAISTAEDGEMRIWDLREKKCLAEIQTESRKDFPIDLTANGQIAVFGQGSDIVVWDLNTQSIVKRLSGHTDTVTTLAITPDGNTIISGSNDMTARIWHVSSGRCLSSLERHTGKIISVGMDDSARRAVSCGNDGRIAIWDINSLTCILEYVQQKHKPKRAVITQDLKKVFFTTDDRTVNVWELNEKILQQLSEQTHYTNAKVLLVGDSGVGKSGLALRLTENRFEPTVSTDAHWVTQLNLPFDTSTEDVDREIWLWDFAGQADYRLIHQLFMDETSLAVLVFNPQNENPFEGLSQWDRDISRAARKSFRKLLVAGRCDRGGLMIGRSSIEQFRKEQGFTEFIETSALIGTGCEKLKDAIIQNIQWDDIPWVASPRIFRILKDEIIKLRDEGKVLLRTTELKQQLEIRLAGENFGMEQLKTVTGLLAGPGVIWKLEFGDFVLLQPERINAYAAAVIRSVRAHAEEIGCILEEDVLAGKLNYQDMKRLPSNDEQIVLRAMHQTFIDHGLCLRERTENGTLLVFPSYFRRERPELERHPAPVVTYLFNGSLDEIYATLVVKLSYTMPFQKDRLWRYAADFKTESNQRIGFKMVKKSEGEAELTIYSAPNISEDTQVTFIRYIHEHLKSKSSSIKRERHYICNHCGSPIENRRVIRDRLERGLTDIICVNCEKRIVLWDLIEEKFASEESQIRVQQLEREAQKRIENDSRGLILLGHTIVITGEAKQLFRQYTKSDFGIDGEIEFLDLDNKPSGKKLYLQLNLDGMYTYRQNDDGTDGLTIKDRIYVDYWKSRKFPVMLVNRSADGTIRWMDIKEYFKMFKDTNNILFNGAPFTAPELLKFRDKLIDSPAIKNNSNLQA